MSKSSNSPKRAAETVAIHNTFAQSWRAVGVFAWTQLKRFFRDPVSMFFTTLFPLIFLLIFGTIFGNTSTVEFKVAVFNQSDSAFAKEFQDRIGDEKIYKLVEADSIDDAKEKMSRGEIDTIIELPKNFGENADCAPAVESGVAQTLPACLPSGALNVYYEKSSPEAGQTVASILGSTLEQINQNLTQTKPLLTVNTKEIARTNVSQFDYTFAGLLAFTVMTMAIFGLSNQFPSEKRSGAMRRIEATPFRPWQIMIGMALAYTALIAISFALMLIVGTLLYHFEMRGSYLLLIPFALLGAIVMCGFGLIISGWAKNENQSAPLAQLIAFPMMFLSGMFFPLYLLPDWLRSITAWLPMTPIGEGLRFITAEGAGLMQLLPQIGLLAAWGVVAYLVAFKVFRWE